MARVGATVLHRGVRALGCCVALKLLLAAAPPNAHAQSRPNALIFSAGRVVPANGGVLVLVPTTGVLGAGAKAVPATVEVSDGGETVDGQVREIGWVENVEALSLDTTDVVGVGLVWTAAKPLRAGASYDIHVQVRDGGLQHASFLAGADWETQQPTITLDARLETRDTGQQEEHCCSAFDDSANHDECFVSRYAELPAVATSLSTTEAPEHLEQFVYLYRAFAPDDTTLWETGFRTYDSPLELVPFFTPRDPYCVEVQAMHVVDAHVFGWSRCLPASDLQGALPDPTQGIADGLRIEHCSVPRYGDVLQWCELNREPCAAGDNPDCAAYAAICDVSLPEALDVILAVQAAQRTTTRDPSTHAHPATAVTDNSLRSPQGGGCSARGVARRDHEGIAPAGVGSVLLLLLQRVRMRRDLVRRRHPQ
jgi:hypothetical protein